MDGSIAKDIPMVVNPRYLLSRLHREGLRGHRLDSRLYFPSGTCLVMCSDVFSVDVYPAYDDTAARQAVAVAGCVHMETAVRQVIDVCRWRMVSFVN